MKLIRTLKEKAKKLKLETAAVYFAFTDKRTPLFAKAFLFLVLCYVLSPIDLLPDFIPILGLLDDLLLMPLFMMLAIKMIPENIMKDSREKAVKAGINKKIGLLGAALFMLIWIIVAILGWRFYQRKTNPV